MWLRGYQVPNIVLAEEFTISITVSIVEQARGLIAGWIEKLPSGDTELGLFIAAPSSLPGLLFTL